MVSGFVFHLACSRCSQEMWAREGELKKVLGESQILLLIPIIEIKCSFRSIFN